MTIARASLVLTLAFYSHLPMAEPIIFQSGIRQNTLVELFTSEECSSCPPAEGYLNSLKDHPQIWKSYIPVAFHVDYWDYIGWKDRFASPQHSQRQQQYARLHRARTVYTPAFFINGKPWRRGLLGREPNTDSRQVGTLRVRIHKNEIMAEWKPVDQKTGKRQLHVALLGMGLTTEIEAGENEGRHSRHEFVVLGMNKAESTANRWRVPLPTNDRLSAPQYAVTVWVSAAGDPIPLQAVGGYLK